MQRGSEQIIRFVFLGMPLRGNCVSGMIYSFILVVLTYTQLTGLNKFPLMVKCEHRGRVKTRLVGEPDAFNGD